MAEQGPDHPWHATVQVFDNLNAFKFPLTAAGAWS
jgi:hypothetical protein